MGLVYWEQFTKTGKIEDYLRYRNENLQEAEEGKRESVGNSDSTGMRIFKKQRKANVNQSVTVTGIVLSVTPIGEYDKRVVILTKERGRISAFAKGARKPNSPLGGAVSPFCSAFAKGARKPNSPLGGAVSPFCFGEFILYEGRTSYNIMQVNIANYFQELRSDMEAAYYGFYFMEFAEYYTREYNDETQMLKLLYQTFRALTNKNISNALIRCIFELKAIYINGEGPQVFQCVKCGDTERPVVFSAKEGGVVCSECMQGVYDDMEIIYINGEGPQVFQCVKCGDTERPVVFSAKEGGVVCSECMQGVYDDMEIDTSTLYAMQYVASSTIEKLYTFTVADSVLYNLKKIIGRYISVYIDKQFKSLEILEICVK